jgi:hypothetical protein
MVTEAGPPTRPLTPDPSAPPLTSRSGGPSEIQDAVALHFLTGLCEPRGRHLKNDVLDNSAVRCNSIDMISDVLAVLALLLSVATFVFTQRFAQASERRSRIPVLVFTYNSDGHWVLRNVGNGPALNITLAIKVKHEDDAWQHPTRIPPIARGSEFQLDWFGDSDVAVMAVSYEDFLTADTSGQSRVYTTSMTYDINRVVPGRELPSWEVGESLAHWQRRPN